MSISKALIFDFSDGTNTVYTRQATLYVPFEVDNFKVVNCYTYVNTAGLGGTPVAFSITSDLVEGSQNFLTLKRTFTNNNPTHHFYKIPRPINGTYNFTANFSNTLYTFTNGGHTRNVVVVGNGNVADITITVSGGVIPPLTAGVMNVLDKFYQANGSQYGATPVRIIAKISDTVYQINQSLAIPDGTSLYYGYTDKIHLDPQVGQAPDEGQAPDPRAIGNSGATFLEYPNNYIVSVHSDGAPYYIMNQPAIIGSMLPAVAGSGGRNQALSYNIPQVYNFWNITKAEVLIDIEFYEKFKLYETLKIKNYQYVLWSIENLVDATKYIDIPFPVDEIEITNVDMNDDDELPISGFYSNLVNSSTTDQDLINHNYTNGIFFSSYSTANYQVNQKNFLFLNPQFFSGQYSISSRTCIDNLVRAIDGTFRVYFQIKFIQYKKE